MTLRDTYLIYIQSVCRLSRVLTSNHLAHVRQCPIAVGYFLAAAQPDHIRKGAIWGQVVPCYLNLLMRFSFNLTILFRPRSLYPARDHLWTFSSVRESYLMGWLS